MTYGIKTDKCVYIIQFFQEKLVNHASPPPLYFNFEFNFTYKLIYMNSYIWIHKLFPVQINTYKFVYTNSYIQNSIKTNLHIKFTYVNSDNTNCYKQIRTNLWSSDSKKTSLFQKKDFHLEPRYVGMFTFSTEKLRHRRINLRHWLVQFYLCTRTPSKICNLYESISKPYSQPLFSTGQVIQNTWAVPDNRQTNT